MAYTAEELTKMYANEVTRTNILRLAGIGKLMSQSIVVPRYKIPAHLHESLVFTEAGEKMIRDLGSTRSVNWGEQRLAVFLELQHDELFVDPDETNIVALRAGLSQEIIKGNIMHPFIWGRELYDKAHDQIATSNLHSLDSKKTIEFLKGTPKGIFQVGDTIVGPWGALQSQEWRYVPPTLNPKLYHCEKPGCLNAHRTRLTTSDNSILTTRARLSKKLFQRGVDSNWSKFLSPLEARLSGRYDDSCTSDVVGLVAECFSETELRSIALRALGDKSLELRRVAAAEGIVIRGAGDFLDGLCPPEVAQLLLLMEDHKIFHAIDTSIRHGDIAIPGGEVRAPRLNGRRTGYFDTSLQCSNRGVRVHSASIWTPMRRLRRLIRDVYSDATYGARLQWKTRDIEGSTEEERLDNYIRSNSIHKIVRDLFLSGPDVFQKAAAKLGLLNDGPRSDSELISDFTWKLGFPLDLEDKGASDLRSNAKALRDVAMQFNQYGEEQKRLIRSHSPNLFVALEEALDRSLVFSTWLTTVDHWVETPRFTFFVDDARRHAAALLSSYSLEKGDPIVFNGGGVNTLFPLISGFGLLASYLENEASDPAKHERPKAELPPVFSGSDLINFAYTSRLPFLNFPERVRELLIQELRNASRELSVGEISKVRNSLEHHKGHFPHQREIVSCVDSIMRICDSIEEFGILPMMFELKSHSRDSDGRAQYIYEDYSGRSVEVTAPSTVIVSGGPDAFRNQIIVPGLISGGESWVPRFNSGIRSEFTEMWHDWPRPRRLSDDLIDAPEMQSDSESVEPSSDSSSSVL